ncbi:organic solute transporter Ostalpha-domain-containing protein [Infundibulicybe gibba]|nr:organic solute transporter Ostalpha-domain-containing protein [Infundibulicybe gibba]
MSSESHASNATCHKEVAPSGPSLFQHGNLVFQSASHSMQLNLLDTEQIGMNSISCMDSPTKQVVDPLIKACQVGWLIAGFFTLVATAVSIWLVNKHLQWYTNKREQRYIVRLLFMVPIYAIISFASFLFWNHSTPLLLIRDGYESTVLTAFFYLLLMYLSHDPEEQRAIFLKAGLSREADRIARQKGDEVEKWVFPMGFVKWKPQDGLYFLQLMKWGVLQYCVIRPTTTLAAVIMDYMGLYCEESWGLGWGHIYITIVVSLSVTIAMYCLIQLYIPVAKNLAPHKPLLKLFAVKAVVFLTFWQATFLSLLSIFGVVKDTKFMTAADINIGIGALLECFEMTIFAFLHIKAFTYKPYQPFHHQNKLRGREPTPDLHVKRAAYYEGAFGRPRPSYITGPKNLAREKPSSGMEVEVEERVEVEVEGERQWLGLGDNYGYGLGYFKRERSDSLEVEIARELQRRGYTNGRGHIRPVHEKESTRDKPGRRHSWWRSAYNRISQTGRDEDEAYSLSARRRGRATSLSIAKTGIGHYMTAMTLKTRLPRASSTPIRNKSSGQPRGNKQRTVYPNSGGPREIR